MESNPQNYCVVIGDIVESKNLPPTERAEAQTRLITLLDSVNSVFADDIAAKGVITQGDEFQILLRTAAGIDIDRFLRLLAIEFSPFKLRIGIGIGGVYTAIDPQRADTADGSAYHRAREVLDRLKERPIKAKCAALCAGVETGNADSDILNALFDRLYRDSSKWTPRQVEIIRFLSEPLTRLTYPFDSPSSEYHRFITHMPEWKQRRVTRIQLIHGERVTYDDAAKALGIVPSTVSRVLAAANYNDCLSDLSTIAYYLRTSYGNK